MPVPVRNTVAPPMRPTGPEGPRPEAPPLQAQVDTAAAPCVETAADSPPATSADSVPQNELLALMPNLLWAMQDKDGSKRLQALLETATEAERDAVFETVMPHAVALFTDVCGNHVMQRMLQCATPGQHLAFRQVIAEHVMELSLNTFGCRVVQRALEVFSKHYDDCLGLPEYLQPLAATLITDQHGNHVLQRCLDVRPASAVWLAGELKGRLVATSCQKFGCRVVQKLIATVAAEPALLPVLDAVVEEVLGGVTHLATDQFGNYVVQAIMTSDCPSALRPVYFLRGHYATLCRHKNASNVVETAFNVSPPGLKNALLAEICPCVVQLSGDPYGNYVVQNIYGACDGQDRNALAAALKAGASFLRTSIYGRSVLAMLQRNGVVVEKPSNQNNNNGNSGNAVNAVDFHLPCPEALPFPDLQRQQFANMVRGIHQPPMMMAAPQQQQQMPPPLQMPQQQMMYAPQQHQQQQILHPVHQQQQQQQQHLPLTQQHLNHLPAMPALVQSSATQSLASLPEPSPPLVAMPPLTTDMNNSQVLGMLPPLDPMSPPPPQSTTSFHTNSSDWATHNPQYDSVEALPIHPSAPQLSTPSRRQEIDPQFCTSPDNDPSQVYMYSY